MLKMTGLCDKPAPGKNNGSKSAFNKINNKKPVFRRNDANSDIDRLSVSNDGVKYAKKSGKLKSQKLAKFQKLLKSGNSPNFGTIKAEPNFLTPSAKEVFNHLQLVFTEASILWHYNPECQI